MVGEVVDAGSRARKLTDPELTEAVRVAESYYAARAEAQLEVPLAPYVPRPPRPCGPLCRSARLDGGAGAPAIRV